MSEGFTEICFWAASWEGNMRSKVFGAWCRLCYLCWFNFGHCVVQLSQVLKLYLRGLLMCHFKKRELRMNHIQMLFKNCWKLYQTNVNMSLKNIMCPFFKPRSSMWLGKSELNFLFFLHFISLTFAVSPSLLSSSPPSPGSNRPDDFGCEGLGSPFALPDIPEMCRVSYCTWTDTTVRQWGGGRMLMWGNIEEEEWWARGRKVSWQLAGFHTNILPKKLSKENAKVHMSFHKLWLCD